MDFNAMDDFYNTEFVGPDRKSFEDLLDEQQKENKLPSFPKIHFAKELSQLNNLEQNKTKGYQNAKATNHSKFEKLNSNITNKKDDNFSKIEYNSYNQCYPNHEKNDKSIISKSKSGILKCKKTSPSCFSKEENNKEVKNEDKKVSIDQARSYYEKEIRLKNLKEMMLKTQRNQKQKMIEEEEKKVIYEKPKLSKRKSEILFTRLFKEAIKREESLEKGRIKKKLKDSKIIADYFIPSHHSERKIPTNDNNQVFERLQNDILHRRESLLINEKSSTKKKDILNKTKKENKRKRNSVISQHSSSVFDVKNSKFVTLKNSPTLINKFSDNNIQYPIEKNNGLNVNDNNSLEGLKALKLCNLI